MDLMKFLAANSVPITPLNNVLFAERMFAVLRDPRFPKREPAQIEFLASSLAGVGAITARRAREICARARVPVQHRILRKEYFIECSCGYEGPALDGGCRECGATALSDSELPEGLPLDAYRDFDLARRMEQLSQVWREIREKLRDPATTDDVTKIFNKAGLDFGWVPQHSQRILMVIRERNFPRERINSQIRFLAESLVFEKLSPQNSRREFAKERKQRRRL